MCVIIVKQHNNTIATDIIKNAARINADGLGIVWLDTYDITYHKSNEYMVLNTKRPFIAHFRYATIGKVGLSNTHPFQCGAQKNEYLMMNGHIHGLGNAEKCDSKVLAEALGKVPRHTWKQELEKHKTVRFLSVNVRNRQFQIYNRDLWTFKDGVWYSKTNVIQEHVVAVYGTLKKGNGNYYNYLSDSTFMGSGVTADKYPLIVQGLPYLVNKKGIGHNVEVDVFKVSSDTFASLDRLEGHPTWYKRELTQITMNDGSVKFAWVYFNPMEIKPSDTFHKSYVYKPYAPQQKFNVGYKPQRTHQARWSAFEYEKPYCTSCYHDLKKLGTWHECKACGEMYTQAEVDRLLY
jgi:gamma-glutamylaminecyclotransferase